jgi:hypothetical protein
MRINVRLAAVFRPLGGHGKDRRDPVIAAPVGSRTNIQRPMGFKKYFN